MEFDWPHIHLLINHFPIILAVMGAAAVVLALINHSRGVWLYGLASLFFMGLSAGPTAFTGDRADDAQHDPWYIVRGAIDKHDDAAMWAMYVMIVTGVIAAYAWWRAVRRDRDAQQSPVWLRVLVLVGALMSLATVTRASLLGGEIVHGSSILAGQRPIGVPAQLPPPGERP